MYTLKALSEDVFKKRGRLLEQGGGQPHEDYMQVWDTFNRYVTACLGQRRGVNVTNFCRIGWHLEKKRGGKILYRPYFQLCDSFCRAYGVDETRKPIVPPEKELCTMEEFNFSKAAIKFSQNLTKDVMFTGLRAIVQQLGEVVSEGRPISLDFEFGRLLGKERAPHFAFAAAIYTREGLPVPAGAQEKCDYAPTVTFAPPSQDALSLNVAGTRAGAPASDAGLRCEPATPEAQCHRIDPPVEVPPSPVRSLPPSRGGESCAGDINKGTTYRGRTPSDGRSTAASSRRSHSLPNGSSASDTSGCSQQPIQEAAYREAMDRHINEMETRAAQVIKEKHEWQGHIQNCIGQEREDQNRRRELNEANQDFVKKQMAYNEHKRHAGRKTFIENASAHEFPVFTEPPANELEIKQKKQQEKMRSDLDIQVRTNNTLRNIARQRERDLEHNQLEANRQEMAMLRSLDRNKKEHQKEHLTMAWNRDVRMKNIWKAIDGHGNAPIGPSHLGIDEAAGPPATPGLASCRSASLSSLGSRIMTGSQRRAPMGAAMSLDKQRERLKL